MTKINVLDLDQKIRNAGIPIDGIGRNSDGSPRVDFHISTTEQQKVQALIIAAAYDQDAEDAAKATTETAKQADLDLVRKAQAGLTQLQSDLAGIDAMNAAQVRDVVKHAITIEIGIIKALMRVL